MGFNLIFLFSMMVVLMLAAASALAAVDCEDWLREEFFETATVDDVRSCIDAGADPGARNDAGKVPFDYVKDNEALKGTEAYRLLSDGRFE